MHIAVDLYALYYFVSVCLEAAVEVVQVLDTRNFACSGIEQLCGDGLGKRVVALLLVSRYKVVSIFGYHAVEDGDFVGAVLKVGIHCDDYVAFGTLESAVESG